MKALAILSISPGASVQDGGRPGWKRFGIPPGGAMDTTSARWANLLVGNRPSAPVVELLFGGATLRAISPIVLALTGAESEASAPAWRSFALQEGEELHISRVRHGLWSYLAISGGFCGSEFFGSRSVNLRAGLGASLHAGDILESGDHGGETAIAGRFLPSDKRPDFDRKVVLPVWEGPEWNFLSEEGRRQFLGAEWQVSSRSDRSGYRLEGPILQREARQILSAPVPVGTIQVPTDGSPIVLMRDGPTVGGYPRVAILESQTVSRFAQCAPGSSVRFEVIE